MEYPIKTVVIGTDELDRLRIEVAALSAQLVEATARAERAEARIAELDQWQKCCGELNVKLSDAYADIGRIQRESNFLRHELSEQGRLLRVECDEAKAALDISREAHRMVQSALLSQAEEAEAALSALTRDK